MNNAIINQRGYMYMKTEKTTATGVLLNVSTEKVSQFSLFSLVYLTPPYVFDIGLAYGRHLLCDIANSLSWHRYI